MVFGSWGLRARLSAAFGVMVLVAVAMAAFSSMRLASMAAMGAQGPVAMQGELASARFFLWGLAALAVALGMLFALELARAITGPLAEAVLIAETVAAGDLSQDFETERQGEFGRLLGALGTMEDTLTDLVIDIKQAAGTITVASQQLAVGNSDLSQRTEDQAASLEQTAASMEQLTVTVRQNAERASSASRMASGAAEIAQRGGALVSQVVATMQAIDGSSRKISDIIGVIEGIAAQTNILALNAAVEAARAGEQGRGFAVVASEVRSLARRSSEAAHEIKLLIDQSVRQVGSGTALVGEAGQTMEQIVQSVDGVHGVLQEISVASSEQSAGIDQVHQAVSHLDGVTQQNALLVQQGAQATQALAEQAERLQVAVDAFKV